MELFDKKFVHFMWDDELEGKKVFIADYIDDLCDYVEKGNESNLCEVKRNDYADAPFRTDDIYTWRFAYYDENYEVKKAFNEGKKIQYRVKGFVDWENYTNQNPCWDDKDREWRVKPEEEQWIAYLAREIDGSCYLSACTDSYWKDVQKEFDAKTKLFIGAYDEVNEWYEFRQKFSEVIKAWEDGKEIQVKAFTGLWYSDSNPDWDVDAEYRVKLEDEKWIVYLDRLHDYLTACLEDKWEDVQKQYHAKTKLFIGTESEVEEWYESRQKFTQVIKDWEDGKEIQFKTSIGVWHLVFMPDWNVDIEYRVKLEGDKMTPTWSNIEDCRHCVYEPKATTQEPCDKCFGNMFERKEKKLRPYINSAEMIADFIGRFKVYCPSYCEPQIWIKDKEVDRRALVSAFREDSVSIDFNPFIIGFEQLFNDYTYLDGTPCGMEVK